MSNQQLVSFIHSNPRISLAELISRLRPIPPGRWTVEIDGRKLGHAVTSHSLGVAWAAWNWTEGGRTHSLRASQGEQFTLLIDGETVSSPKMRVSVGSEGKFPKVHLILHFVFSVDGVRHDFRFAGRVN